jgi:transcriptional regulator
MYLPPHFAEHRVEVLHDALREAGLFTVVTHLGGLDAEHLPLLLEPTPAPLGRLVGHVARGNPLWSRLGAGAPALAVAVGPDAYVTPSWYPSKRETGRVVPTWNYVAVHAHGTLRAFDDRERLRGVVGRLTERHERGRPAPWTVADAPADYLEDMLAGIVGVELTIERLEGKWKTSQNRTAPDRRGVAEGLDAAGERELASHVLRHGG